MESGLREQKDTSKREEFYTQSLLQSNGKEWVALHINHAVGVLQRRFKSEFGMDLPENLKGNFIKHVYEAEDMLKKEEKSKASEDDIRYLISFIREFYEKAVEHMMLNDLLNISQLTILKLRAGQEEKAEIDLEYFAHLPQHERDIFNRSPLFKKIYQQFSVENFDAMLNDPTNLPQIFKALGEKIHSAWESVKLQDGDLMFELSQIPKSKATPKDFLQEIDEKKSVAHAMIYSKGNVYHSNPGDYRSGVRGHDLLYVLAKKTSPELGHWVVFRPKEKKLRKFLAEIAMRWDPMATIRAEEAKTGKKIKRLDTPYVKSRITDEKSQLGEAEGIFEFFRSYRAFERNRLKKPLSKNQGVDCSQFVGFCLKAAVFQQLFPGEVPQKIKEKFLEIEAKKKEANVKKLHDIPDAEKLFLEFKNVVKECLEEKGRAIVKNQAEYFDFLSLPTKGKDIEYLFQILFAKEKFFDFTGSIFFKEFQELAQLAVMNYATAQESFSGGSPLCMARSESIAERCLSLLATLDANQICKVIKEDVEKGKYVEEFWREVSDLAQSQSSELYGKISMALDSEAELKVPESVQVPEQIKQGLSEIFLQRQMNFLVDSIKEAIEFKMARGGKMLSAEEEKFLDNMLAILKNGPVFVDKNKLEHELHFIITQQMGGAGIQFSSSFVAAVGALNKSVTLQADRTSAQMLTQTCVFKTTSVVREKQAAATASGDSVRPDDKKRDDDSVESVSAKEYKD